jgi:hypothetical protein
MSDIRVDHVLLSAVMDRLIPPIDGLAGAGSMGLADEVIERAEADVRLSEALAGVMGKLPQGPKFKAMSDSIRDETLHTVESEIPAEFGLFVDLVYTVYYMQPDVHRRLGWHGRPPQPDGNTMPPWDESVIERIRLREPFWRKV